MLRFEVHQKDQVMFGFQMFYQWSMLTKVACSCSFNVYLVLWLSCGCTNLLWYCQCPGLWDSLSDISQEMWDAMAMHAETSHVHAYNFCRYLLTSHSAAFSSEIWQRSSFLSPPTSYANSKAFGKYL